MWILKIGDGILRKLTTEEFVERARNIHGDTYDYSQVEYMGMEVPVKIICSKHGEFLQSPNNHLKGHGCLQCTKIDDRKLGLNGFVDKARQVHGDLYDYSKSVYVNSKTPVTIICSKHGEFQQSPNKHLQGQGCPRCAKNCRDTKESFIEKARDVHGELYDYSKVSYVDTYVKVCIIDPVYGEFWQTPNAHLNGRGHPGRKAEKCHDTKKANGTLFSSKPEDIVGVLLRRKFGKSNVFMHHKTSLYPFACDFYIKSFDLYIELNIYMTHGGHWFDAQDPSDVAILDDIQRRSDALGNRNRYQKKIEVWAGTDLKKRDVAIRNNLNYLVFWDDDLSDFCLWYGAFDKNNPVLKNV